MCGPSAHNIRMVQLYVGPAITMRCGWILHTLVEHTGRKHTSMMLFTCITVMI